MRNLKLERNLALPPFLLFGLITVASAVTGCSSGGGKGAVADVQEDVVVTPCDDWTAEAPSIDSLVGYYPLDCNAQDLSAAQNHGTIHGAELTEDRFGNAGRALHFDGKGDYVELSAKAIGASPHSFSVSLWFRTTTQYKSGLFFEGVLNGQAIFLRVDPGANRLLAHSNDHFETLKSKDNSFADGAWHHLVLTGSDGSVSLWIDGSMIDEGNWLDGEEGTKPMNDTGHPAVFGREGQPDVDKATNYFEGDLDDIAIVQRPLSNKEIVSLWKSGPNQLPNAVIKPKVLGLEVTLTGSGSFDSDGEIVSYEWDFGDGSKTESTPDAVHTYAKGGVYQISLTVADDEGATTTSTAIVEAIDPTVHTGDGSWPQEWADRELDVIDLVNERRAEGAVCGGEPYGKCGPVEKNQLCTISARLHSEDMAKNNYFDHTGLNGSTPFDRMAAAGYAGPYPWGENIAAGQTSPAQVVQAWMDSPGHCRNIMNCGFKVLGVGYFHSDGSQMKHYWTQNFGGGH